MTRWLGYRGDVDPLADQLAAEGVAQLVRMDAVDGQHVLDGAGAHAAPAQGRLSFLKIL